MTEERSLFFAIASTLPLMVIRLTAGALRMGFRIRRGASTFNKELKRSGLPPDLARKLAARYREQWSLRRIISFAVKQARS